MALRCVEKAFMFSVRNPLPVCLRQLDKGLVHARFELVEIAQALGPGARVLGRNTDIRIRAHGKNRHICFFTDEVLGHA